MRHAITGIGIILGKLRAESLELCSLALFRAYVVAALRMSHVSHETLACDPTVLEMTKKKRSCTTDSLMLLPFAEFLDPNVDLHSIHDCLGLGLPVA
jgi:hypothetical protein